ncbi:hypothetical protein PDE_05620 [Penicillium oxalicum 114-2]|uniref:Uncharacterized protein n=1 Tax=Penicillium oxalicum (strain 114-2 / CGMCC 5302) TaxID=933388 RepID=S8AWJ9_PENO1|nr:hypothetical protein PDE_05620 [Penicillium oxalicum 114-2]
MSSYRMQAVQRGGNEGLESSSGDHALTSHTSLPHINSDGFFTLLPPFVSRASPKKRHHESMVDLPGPRLPQVPVSESYVSSALFTSETSTYAVPSIESSPNRLGLVARRSSSDLSVHSLASLEVTPNGLAEPCHDSHWDAEVTYLNGTHDSDLVQEMQPAPCYVPYAQPILAKAASVDSDGIHSLYSETEQCPAMISHIVAALNTRTRPDKQAVQRPSLRGHFMASLQRKPIHCDYIKSLRDIRAEPSSDVAPHGWLIEEGSVVIGVGPSYVVSTGDDQPLDQLDLKEGKLYVVEQIFGDMWALCSEFSTSQPNRHGKVAGSPNRLAGLGFLPLCAVTLAANYGTFLERCREYRHSPDQSLLTPANGGCVLPSVRVQSVDVSREMDYWSLRGRQAFKPKKAHAVCQKFRPIGENDDEWEPKDPFNHFKRKVPSLRRVWRKLKPEKLDVKTGIRDLCGWVRGH